MLDYKAFERMDDLGRLDSPLHRLDARAKLITTVLFLAVLSSFGPYELAALIPFSIYPVALAIKGNLPVRFLVRKVVVASPVVLFLGGFNVMFDQQPVVLFGSFSVTGGVLSFGSILVRFILTVSSVLVLVASSGIYRLCAGAGQLGLPRILVVQILFLYRYFFVIGEEGGRMVRSAAMRSNAGNSIQFRTYGALLGHLLLRSIDRAHRVYRSMKSRGFDGQIRLLPSAEMGWKEWCFIVGWGGYFLVARLWSGVNFCLF